MSWLADEHSRLSRLARFCGNVIKLGRTPKHVAIIMDGNRRYAKKLGLERHSGHLHGFHKLTEVLEWCLLLNIREVSVYAFSTENFKRPSDEVDYLMNLAREKFAQLLNETEKLNQYRVRVRFVGDLTLLPLDVQQMCAKVMLSTIHNERFFFNVFISYASRVEMCAAANLVADGVRNGQLQLSDINSSLLDACCWTTMHHRSPSEDFSQNSDACGPKSNALWSAECDVRKRVVESDKATKSIMASPSAPTKQSVTPIVGSYPDLVVRTSGEIRLSDYLLWQSCFSELVFYDVYWPEFSVWHFYAAVLRYRMHADSITSMKLSAFESIQNSEQQLSSESAERQRDFLSQLDAENFEWLSAAAAAQ